MSGVPAEPQPAGTGSAGQISAIQLMRAVAALMVVFSHAQNDLTVEAVRRGLAFVRVHALPWDSGVDLFFVISGFIMVHASERLFGTREGWRTFLTHRVIRIVPLYWLVTGIALLVLAYGAAIGKLAFPPLSEIASSLGFWPYGRPGDGEPRPLAAQGWTLNYEMYFYVVFAAWLALPRTKAVIGATLMLVGIVAIGSLLAPVSTALAYWSDPIALEFVLGMWLALAFRAGLRLGTGPALLLAALGLAVLALDLDGMGAVGPIAADPNGWSRLLGCGVPMAMIFAAATFRRPAPRPGLPGRATLIATLLGDASYALYLFHPLALVATRKAYMALGLAESLGLWPAAALGMLAATALAIAVHLGLERPITRRLRALADRPRDGAGAPRGPVALPAFPTLPAGTSRPAP